jgi:probable F420-dependent oxidoreductase
MAVKFGISTFVTDHGIRPAPLARAVEERGFDSLFVGEHTHIPVDTKSQYPAGGEIPAKYYRTLDPFLTLAVAAAVTERILLGTAVVLVSERDPIITAKEVATLDLVSDGRAVLGIGVGWNLEEMMNHGTNPKTRGRLVTERLHAIRTLWKEEKAEFHGDFVDFDPVYSWPKPVREPHPPIYVGGGAASFPRIAEVGDGWLALPFHDIGPMRKQLREKAGRDVPVTVLDIQHDPAKLAEYAEAGAERVLLELPTMPEAESLRELDHCAELVAGLS